MRKIVTENSEVVSYTDEEGKVLRKHKADFKLELSGRVRLFTYFNLRVEEGKGEVQTGESSYIYRVDADTFTEVHGMLVGDKTSAKLTKYRRVTDPG